MEKNASDIIISFYHPDLRILSDRTFRSLLKKISKICRKVLSAEVEAILYEVDLSDSHRQSLNDRMKNKLKNFETHYIEALNQKSTEIIIVLTGMSYFILAKTIGETIKEAWLESVIHKKIKKILLKEWRIDNTPEIIKNIVSETNLTPFHLKNIEINYNKDETKIKIILNSLQDVEGKQRIFNKILIQDAIEEIQLKINLAKGKNKEQGKDGED